MKSLKPSHLPQKKALQALCPICEVRWHIIWREGYALARHCPSCGLIMSEYERPMAFDERYFQNYKRYLESPTAFQVRIRYIQELVDSLPTELEAPLLDIGAGLGFFIRALPSDLAQATTLVEPSAFARQYLTETNAAGVFASLEGIQADYPRFATVTLWDVLAHVNDPLTTLKQAHQLMQYKALLIVKTPYHPLRLFRAARLLTPIKKGHSLLHVPSMRFHFTPANLSMLLQASGFTVTSWQWTSEPPTIGLRKTAHIKGFLLRLVQRVVCKKQSFTLLARSN